MNEALCPSPCGEDARFDRQKGFPRNATVPFCRAAAEPHHLLVTFAKPRAGRFGSPSRGAHHSITIACSPPWHPWKFLYHLFRCTLKLWCENVHGLQRDLSCSWCCGAACRKPHARHPQFFCVCAHAAAKPQSEEARGTRRHHRPERVERPAPLQDSLPFSRPAFGCCVTFLWPKTLRGAYRFMVLGFGDPTRTGTQLERCPRDAPRRVARFESIKIEWRRCLDPCWLWRQTPKGGQEV